ncbi:HlyD family efflux transporter periplasmic adaptor subunit [Campylobacter fetus]|uniref:HlyD family efflux transporter periplasmic adaptor subunit n=2 Tax=Campylobacter fetus TaxID=196 RepID=A0A5L8J7W9_CAMFE|nr:MULTISPECIES: HlyD family efflux transporter periplasmic adaptor subunit [Campylobacter]OCS22967.1 secretion protein HlyD [Campylobacter fetus subsp. venerealis cfvi97/532]OCS27162.1 secretion protein HlyD [Campylobacter fetus subsp. venerealis cfvB10]OCS30267.1 secretion protein HlyD [Campylobacter fetus subsp. venerealis LMG 6570 = CCUG 33900]OCS42990.1 secretion protein HlyD [Campylobacter fetus subsp. venerealis cfvi02/298]AHE93604.1 ABC transporter, membrane fusion protein (HlyD family
MKKLGVIGVVLVLIFLFYKFYEKEFILKDKDDIFYGNVDTKTVDLSFRFLGEIVDISKIEGAKVSKGEPLVYLDDSYLQNSLNSLKSKINIENINLLKLESGYRIEEIKQSKARLEAAAANLKETQNSFNRQQKLMLSKATSEEAFMTAQTRFEAAKANLNLAQANYELLKNGYQKEDIEAQRELVRYLNINLEAIELDIKNSVLISPYDGILQKRYKEIGAITNANEPVVEIARDDKYFIRAYIDEKNLGKIKLEQKMKIFSDARSEPYLGYINFISSVAEFTPKNIQTTELRSDLVYKFEVTLIDKDDRLKQGMPVHIKFNDQSN